LNTVYRSHRTSSWGGDAIYQLKNKSNCIQTSPPVSNSFFGVYLAHHVQILRPGHGPRQALERVFATLESQQMTRP